MTLLEPHNLPFAGAAILLVFIAIIQIAGVGDMFDSGDADVDFDLDVDGPDGLGSGGFQGGSSGIAQ
ncbi:MAG: hypothetical protein AAGK01_08375 [Pseudomonadota bacterium]